MKYALKWGKDYARVADPHDSEATDLGGTTNVAKAYIFDTMGDVLDFVARQAQRWEVSPSSENEPGKVYGQNWYQVVILTDDLSHEVQLP